MKKSKLFLVLMLISTFLFSQEKDQIKWEFGGGVRVSYMKLTGGITGFRASDGQEFDLNYEQIGMSNYSPSTSLTFGGRYRKWNFFFSAARGSYTGSFKSNVDIDRDGVQIPAGSIVDGKISMGIYALTTTFAALQSERADLGFGAGFLLLNMGSWYSTAATDSTEAVDAGGKHVFPMPFLAASGRLKFDRFKISAVGGGAIFDGVMDGYDYKVWYYNYEIRMAYDFHVKNGYTWSVSGGYRSLVMDSKAEKNSNWFREKDIYTGPFIGIRVKFTEWETKEEATAKKIRKQEKKQAKKEVKKQN